MLFDSVVILLGPLLQPDEVDADQGRIQVTDRMKRAPESHAAMKIQGDKFERLDQWAGVSRVAFGARPGPSEALDDPAPDLSHAMLPGPDPAQDVAQSGLILAELRQHIAETAGHPGSGMARNFAFDQPGTRWQIGEMVIQVLSQPTVARHGARSLLSYPAGRPITSETDRD
jgi:hypothetical protein